MQITCRVSIQEIPWWEGNNKEEHIFHKYTLEDSHFLTLIEWKVRALTCLPGNVNVIVLWEEHSLFQHTYKKNNHDKMKTAMQ